MVAVWIVEMLRSEKVIQIQQNKIHKVNQNIIQEIRERQEAKPMQDMKTLNENKKKPKETNSRRKHRGMRYTQNETEGVR